MEFIEKLVCSSSARLPCQEVVKVQTWSENMQKAKGDCLASGYVSSLSKGVHVELKQNDLTELAKLWEQVSGPNKKKFCDQYGQLASLIAVKVDEFLIRAAIQFWDPSYRCFTFNGEDMMPTIEEYSMLIRLNLQCPDKVYYRRPRQGVRKKLAKIMGVKPEDADRYLVNQKGLEWNFMKNFIFGHMNDDHGLATLALAIYGLIIFPRVIGYVETTVIDFFEQIQNHTNPASTIVAETIKSLNYYRKNTDKRFTGCLPLLYVWLQSHFIIRKVLSQSPIFLIACQSRSSVIVSGQGQRRRRDG